MVRDYFDALLSFRKADDYQATHTVLRDPPPPVITLARDHGSGGEAIAAKVAERLGVRAYDKEILDSVVAEAKSNPHLMHRLDEKLPERAGMFLYASLMGLDDPVSEYQRLLTRVVNGIAFGGGVILGRGAHLLLRGQLRFRVRIVGSEEACAQRLAGDDPSAVPAKLEEVRRVNAARAKYFQETFKTSNQDALQYDLILNTDRFPNMDEVADLIVQAYKAHAH
ncbi:MAG TPA: cytidylate kinase-like family protein [Azospirillum sp.]|nr:cytidylate kinase-like family protein [Azospirillum sp.]